MGSSPQDRIEREIAKRDEPFKATSRYHSQGSQLSPPHGKGKIKEVKEDQNGEISGLGTGGKVCCANRGCDGLGVKEEESLTGITDTKNYREQALPVWSMRGRDGGAGMRQGKYFGEREHNTH